jgi:outer membrane receptor protein involved in Fe transport
MKKSFIYIFLLFISCQLSGQNPSTLSGHVIDYKTQIPVPYVTIELSNKKRGVVSDDQGYFSIVVPSDTSTIIISCVGYETVKEKLNPNLPFSEYTIRIKEAVRQLNEVTVTAEKERIARITSEISSVKMSPVLVSKLPNMGEVDIMRSFQLLPGVSATNETSAGLYVRGGTPDQNLILFDGMTIYNVDHFYGFFSAFNANAVDDIELIKGGFPAKYGGRISSVMEITGRLADYKKIKATASVSLLSFNGAMDIPLVKDKLSLQIAVRRSYTDIIRTGLYKKIFNIYSDNTTTTTQQATGGPGGFGRIQTQTQQPSFYFYDLNTKLSWKLNSNNELALSLYNGKDNLNNSRDMNSFGFPGGQSSSSSTHRTDLAGWGNTGASIQWHAKWNEKFKSSAFISYSDYFSNRDIKNSSSSDTSTLSANRSGMNTLEDNNVKDYSTRLNNELQLAKWNTLEFGLENIYNDISYKLTFSDTVKANDKSQHGYRSSFYLQDGINLNKNFDLTLGIRTTYYEITRKMYYEPRLSVGYRVNNNLKFKIAAGRYYQFITRIIREDILQGSKDFWLMADDSVVPVSSANHYIAGFTYEKGSLLLDIEGYYKQLYGLTEYSSRSTTIGLRNGVEREDQFYKGSGTVRGIEIMLQKKYGLNTGWIAYTLSQVINTFPDLNYGKPFYALQDQTHEFKAVYTRKAGNWDFSATFVFATGKPYTAPVDQYQLTMLDGSVYSFIHVSDKNSLRLPDYNRMDISASYSWIGISADKTLSFSIFNVYNRRNIWYKEFTIQSNAMQITNVNYLGFTPNLSFTIRFK